MFFLHLVWSGGQLIFLLPFSLSKTKLTELLYIAFLPSELAAASLACARQSLHMHPVWPESLQYVTEYSQENLTAPMTFLTRLVSPAELLCFLGRNVFSGRLVLRDF